MDWYKVRGVHTAGGALVFVAVLRRCRKHGEVHAQVYPNMQWEDFCARYRGEFGFKDIAESHARKLFPMIEKSPLAPECVDFVRSKRVGVSVCYDAWIPQEFLAEFGKGVDVLNPKMVKILNENGEPETVAITRRGPRQITVQYDSGARSSASRMPYHVRHQQCDDAFAVEMGDFLGSLDGQGVQAVHPSRRHLVKSTAALHEEARAIEQRRRDTFGGATVTDAMGFPSTAAADDAETVVDGGDLGTGIVPVVVEEARADQPAS